MVDMKRMLKSMPLGRFHRLVLTIGLLLPFISMCAGRPLVVGISESCPEGEMSSKVVVNASYADAVSRGGHLPVIIPRFGTDAQFDAIAAKLDVLVMTGGEDIAPVRYDAKSSPKLGKVNVKRDGFDFRLLAAARRRNLPVIGICRGCQLLNVAFGGTLWQDLPSEFPVKDVQHRNMFHWIAIERDSRFARVTGVTNALVNSYHHQAVKDLAPGFRIVAKSPDGVVEAIECDTYPAIGVQFHPEKMQCDEKNDVLAAFFRDIPSLFRDGTIRQ
jgi:gamma-glutamyl-gamma-aminobutyrate hydrolase PuuD